MLRRSILIAAVLTVCAFDKGLWARETGALEAEMVVTGWLKIDCRPLGSELGREVSRVETFLCDGGQAAYHIVYLDPRGFVIVSGDDRVEPVLGFAADGAYDPSCDGPLSALITSDLETRTASLTDRAGLSVQSVSEVAVQAQNKWESLLRLSQAPADRPGVIGVAGSGPGYLSEIRVGPLLRSIWAQKGRCGRSCYNYYTPNHYACGCVALSMAQVMHYHRYPTEGIGRQEFNIAADGVTQYVFTRGGDGNGGPYRWDLMPDQVTCATSEEHCEAVGALCYDAGVSVNMSYSANGSMAGGGDRALRNVFGYGNAVRAGGIENVRNAINPNLDAGYPVIFGIVGGGGHNLVCDGYGYSASTLYHHLNMGHNGPDNAWYNLYDAGITRLSGGTLDKMVGSFVYNIMPSGAGEIISGRITDSSGYAVPWATVTAEGPGGPYVATTNARGIYALVHVHSNAEYSITAQKRGYTFPVQTVRMGESAYKTEPGNRWGIDFGGSFSGLAVDDFEAYDDTGSKIEDAWTDGRGDPKNGAIVGYDGPNRVWREHTVETALVHGGGASMPYFYDTRFKCAEATLILSQLCDWTAQDVAMLSLWFRGHSPPAGSFVFTGGPGQGYEMTATGADIGNRADECHYAYKRLRGPGAIEVRVERVEDVHEWAKAGVMIRETLDSGSRFAGAFVTPSHGCVFQTRTDVNVEAVSDASEASAEQQAMSGNVWLKLERDENDNFRAYYSEVAPSHEAWQPMTWNPLHVPMAHEVYIGLAATSHDPHRTAQAIFTWPETYGDDDPQWESRDIGILRNVPAPMYVAVTDGAGRSASSYQHDPAAALTDAWTQWAIDLRDFSSRGVDLGAVASLSLGFGTGETGATGLVFFDDIHLESATGDLAPINLHATPGPACIDLHWRQYDFDQFSGFNLYRATEPDGAWTRLNAALLSPEQESCRDTDVQPGMTYSYRCVVVTTDAIEAGYSNTARAMPLTVTAPLIQHQPITSAEPHSPVTFLAVVTDETAVESVSLFYRHIGETEYQSRAMVPGHDDRYSVTLEGALVVFPGLEYYIQAGDGLSTAASGSAVDPHRIDVAEDHSDEVVQFADETLRQAVINKLAQSGIITAEPTRRQMEALTFLAVPWGVPITDFSGLEYAVNLEMLGLCGIDLEAIPAGVFAAMPNLWHINLSWNNLTDITPLAEAQSLGSLKMQDNDVTNIDALANLTNLWELELQGNSISDLSALTSLTGLEQLNLLGNPLSADACTIQIPQIIANNPGVTLLQNTCIEPGGNFLINGGFEDGTTAPWNLWGPDGAEPAGQVVHTLEGAAVPEGPAEGDCCLRVRVTGLGAGYWELGLNQAPLLFKAGRRYTLSAWLKCDQGTRDIGFVAIDSDTWGGYGEQVFTMTDTWARYSTTTQALAADVDNIEITFQIGFAVGDFWIDDVQLIEEPQPEPPGRR